MSILQDRIARVREKMVRAEGNQFLITDPFSIYYLTGIYVVPMERFWACLVRGEGEPLLFANRLFALGDTGIPTVTFGDQDSVAELVAPHILPGVLGVDKTLAARFLLPLMAACPGTRMVLGSDWVDAVRAVKDVEEQQRMRRASQINDACMEKLSAFIREGVTERECARYLAACYEEYGCEGQSFDGIISFGANAADPHHAPDNTVIREGDSIVIDIGCRKDHYCSDMTRTFFWKKADPEYVKIYKLVQEANARAESLVKAGVPLGEIDRAARDVIANAGYGEYFTHRLGHFIGMEDHEQGDVSQGNPQLAQAGMIFSIEPGIYLPGRMGVRIEDLVLVTEDGCELFNHVDKGLRVLGA